MITPSIPAFENQPKPKLPRPKPDVARYDLSAKTKSVYITVNNKTGTATLHHWVPTGSGNPADDWCTINLGREHAALFMMLANHVFDGGVCTHTAEETINVEERRHYCGTCNKPMVHYCTRDLNPTGSGRPCRKEILYKITSSDKETGRVTSHLPDFCESCEKEIALKAAVGEEVPDEEL